MTQRVLIRNLAGLIQLEQTLVERLHAKVVDSFITSLSLWISPLRM